MNNITWFKFFLFFLFSIIEHNPCVNHCDISSKLSISDIVQCSKAISYLMKSNAITPIDNTEIFISSYPSAHQIVFVKLQYDKDYEEPDDVKDEDMRYLITKDNYYFCASNHFSNYEI